jgi:predicted DNA-binding antitoxin AbrB/MazE fold protein
MEIEGVVQNGVIVPQGECPLPEGTKVKVVPSEGAPASERWKGLLSLIHRIEQEPCDLPEDLSANHDYYLHGTSKRS